MAIQDMDLLVDAMDPNVVDDVDEAQLLHKTDYRVSPGISYTGQVKLREGAILADDYVQHGRGIQNWDDGSRYEGDWRQGHAHGFGLIQHSNGD